jgi:hypothetical protein
LFVHSVVLVFHLLRMMNYIMIQDWPQDIGGNQVLVTLKICQHLPIMFEMTVFFLVIITFI